MLRNIPGWLNFFLLSIAYAFILIFLRWIFKSQCEDWFLGIIVFTYAGAYLAKWRFHDGGWHFY